MVKAYTVVTSHVAVAGVIALNFANGNSLSSGQTLVNVTKPGQSFHI